MGSITKRIFRKVRASRRSRGTCETTEKVRAARSRRRRRSTRATAGDASTRISSSAKDATDTVSTTASSLFHGPAQKPLIDSPATLIISSSANNPRKPTSHHRATVYACSSVAAVSTASTSMYAPIEPSAARWNHAFSTTACAAGQRMRKRRGISRSGATVTFSSSASIHLTNSCASTLSEPSASTSLKSSPRACRLARGCTSLSRFMNSFTSIEPSWLRSSSAKAASSALRSCSLPCDTMNACCRL